ncbi:MAG: C40 family peptidase [Oscillospiraceae bacterium]|jgi:cell wall-associated NlpC family hydrolase|nr:C40 family peptidase [Oscillospiraceae bacterium]
MMSIKKPARTFICALLIAAAISGAVSVTASAGDIAYGAATVSASLLNVRSGPSTESSIIATVGENVIVVILDKANDEWYYINYNGTKGYAKAEYFKNVLLAENFSAIGTVTAKDVFLRESPSTSANVLGTYDTDTVMSVIGINTGWYKVRYDGKTGYLRSDFMEITGSASGTTRANTAAKSGGSTAPAHSETGNEIADFALQYLGYKYVYGGASPSGFDCSGFTSYVYKQFGYGITRNASGQWRDNGTKISKSELAAGDLVFFSSNGGKSVTHVGLYIGDQEFIHASGTNVGVVISRLDSSYYQNVWWGAKRIA